MYVFLSSFLFFDYDQPKILISMRF